MVAQSPLATPRRAVVGWDTGRLAMVLAVLDTRCGLALTGNDVYLNVAGGLKVSAPAADLAVAAALVSSLTDCPVPQRTGAFGEGGLSGEIRPVAQTDARLKEAAKLGFERVLMPPTRTTANTSLEIVELARLQDLIATFGEPAARSVLAR